MPQTDISLDGSVALYQNTSSALAALQLRFGRVYDAVADFGFPTADSGNPCDSQLNTVFSNTLLNGGVLKMSPRGHILTSMHQIPSNWVLYGETLSIDTFPNINFEAIPYTIYLDPSSNTNNPTGYTLYNNLATSSGNRGCIDLSASSMVYGLTFIRLSGGGPAVFIPSTLIDLCKITDGYLGGTGLTNRIGQTGALFSASNQTTTSNNNGSRASIVNCQIYAFDQVFTAYLARRVRMLNVAGHNRRVAYWGQINDTPRLQSCSNKNNIGENFKLDNMAVTAVEPGSGSPPVLRLTFTLNALNPGSPSSKGLLMGVSNNLITNTNPLYCWISIYPGLMDGAIIPHNAPLGPNRWLVGFVSVSEPGASSTGTAVVDLIGSHMVDSDNVYMYNSDGSPVVGPGLAFSSLQHSDQISQATVRFVAGTGTMGEGFYLADVDTVSAIDCNAFGADIAFRLGSNRFGTLALTSANNVSLVSCSCDAGPTWGEIGTVGQLIEGASNACEIIGGKVGAFSKGIIHRARGASRGNNLIAGSIDADDFGPVLVMTSGLLTVVGGTLAGPVNVRDFSNGATGTPVQAFTMRDVHPGSGTPPPRINFVDSPQGQGYQNTLVSGLEAWLGAPPPSLTATTLLGTTSFEAVGGSAATLQITPSTGVGVATLLTPDSNGLAIQGTLTLGSASATQTILGASVMLPPIVLSSGQTLSSFGAGLSGSGGTLGVAAGRGVYLDAGTLTAQGPFVPIVTSQWYGVPATASVAAAASLGVLTALPVKLRQPKSQVTGIACRVTTLSAGGTVRASTPIVPDDQALSCWVPAPSAPVRPAPRY